MCIVSHFCVVHFFPHLLENARDMREFFVSKRVPNLVASVHLFSRLCYHCRCPV